MCRSLNIPARVVMGFDPATDGDAKTVTGEDVKAWVEIPFEDLGWVSFDVTPDRDQVPQQQTTQKVSNPEPNVLQPPLPNEDPAQLPPNYEDPQRDDPQDNDKGGLPTAVIAVGGSILAIATIVGSVLGWKAWRRSRRRARTGVGKALGAWEEILDRARDLGRSPGWGATRREAAAQLAPHFPQVDLPRFAGAVDIQVFSSGEPPSYALGELWESSDAIVRSMGAERSRLGRAWARLSPALPCPSRREAVTSTQEVAVMTITADARGSASTAAGPPTSSHLPNETARPGVVSPYSMTTTASGDPHGGAAAAPRGSETSTAEPAGHTPSPHQLPPAPLQARIVAGVIDLVIGSLLVGGLTSAIWQVGGRPVLTSGLIAFGVVVGARWLAIATTGWSLGGRLLSIRMLGARNQAPSPLGSFLHADLILAVSISTLGLGGIALMRTAAADPEGRGWHDKLSGMVLLSARRAKRPNRPTPSATQPERRPVAERPHLVAGPLQCPKCRGSRPPRTSVRHGTPPGACPSPPRPRSRALRARSPPQRRPHRPLESRTSRPPTVSPSRGPAARPRRRPGRRHRPGNAAPVRA